ncbi:MAG: hypothetical protein COT90_01505 [Candidatus Diapherotrites archaeon CG10_big_fil_rev_8_21_14_0_10_31_34]|nr:MAG: hypothetical protein COT90_01505 [Candidatus Diapherotrites archaeon CG10_big_fil_rev_8_21_14_0_10_31_34]
MFFLIEFFPFVVSFFLFFFQLNFFSFFSVFLYFFYFFHFIHLFFHGILLAKCFFLSFFQEIFLFF